MHSIYKNIETDRLNIAKIISINLRDVISRKALLRLEVEI